MADSAGDSNIHTKFPGMQVAQDFIAAVGISQLISALMHVAGAYWNLPHTSCTVFTTRQVEGDLGVGKLIQHLYFALIPSWLGLYLQPLKNGIVHPRRLMDPDVFVFGTLVISM